MSYNFDNLLHLHNHNRLDRYRNAILGYLEISIFIKPAKNRMHWRRFLSVLYSSLNIEDSFNNSLWCWPFTDACRANPATTLFSNDNELGTLYVFSDDMYWLWRWVGCHAVQDRPGWILLWLQSHVSRHQTAGGQQLPGEEDQEEEGIHTEWSHWGERHAFRLMWISMIAPAMTLKVVYAIKFVTADILRMNLCRRLTYKLHNSKQ